MDIHLVIVFGLGLWLAVMTLSDEPLEFTDRPGRSKLARSSHTDPGHDGLSADDQPLH
ncbi:hypothetical protein [Luteolibacter marinus]|uniref:hypothetical protein n=1 Tax=Luteolibacter marinus TaxID=2776705 RepID=UPI001867313E|nr:hypothetical protein [Luteolibacter marinus]